MQLLGESSGEAGSIVNSVQSAEKRALLLVEGAASISKRVSSDVDEKDVDTKEN